MDSEIYRIKVTSLGCMETLPCGSGTSAPTDSIAMAITFHGVGPRRIGLKRLINIMCRGGQLFPGEDLVFLTDEGDEVTMPRVLVDDFVAGCQQFIWKLRHCDRVPATLLP